MVGISDKYKEHIKSVMVALASAAAAWAVVALFFPVKISHITGTLDSEKAYKASVATFAYNSAGGYILLLSACVCVVVAIYMLRGSYGPLKGLFWALFCAPLVASTFFTGATPIIAWFPNVPPEVQHAFGSEYATLTEQFLINWPAMVSIGFMVLYGLVVVGLWAVDRGGQHPLKK
jgi:hypothetical protein